MRYFFIFLGLSGIFCAPGAETAPQKDPAANNPAWTGEREEKMGSTATSTAPSVPPKAPATLAPPPVESRVATLATTDLKEYDDQPAAVQKLLAQGLALTSLDLSYRYGSSDPKNGGLDCSGTIYYLLTQAGLKDVPRDASEMYKWVWKESRFESVVSPNGDTFELSRLKPGDLLFWTGTYRVDRDPPVTHVMLYLGTNRHDGHRVMMGASEGRPFDGKSRYGVSVFDFKISSASPRSIPSSTAPAETELQSRFIGYGSVPGLEETGTTEAPQKAEAK